MIEPRRDRAARAHRRRRAVVAGSIVVLASVVLGLGALIASDALRLDSGPGPALAERVAATTATRESDASRKCRSHLTPDDPLRLWIAGDSLAGSLGPSLGARAAATGIVQPTYDSRVSSGLSSPEFFDWPEHASAEMAQLDPEVVIFIVGANDWRTPAGETGWEDEYRLQVEELLGILGDDGDTRHVYWVGSPTMQERRKDQGVQQVNAIAREVVDQHERATYVDAYELFSDEDGAYSATLPGPNGKSVRVRAGDGIHFTVDGGDLLGDFVYAQLEPHCRLDQQAVPDQAKTVLRTRGSDGPSGNSGGGSGTSGRTSPATLPPDTAAPAPAPELPPEPDTTPTTPTAPTTPEDPPEPPAPEVEPPETQTEP